uniref:Zinc finger BED domain-containing protein 1-like n=1 Tax=Eptatretus burgeri TaxID=7764 RepID=A0A8C4N752_EPTBU
MDFTRARGSGVAMPTWLESWGLTDESLRAAVTGLGVEILGALCARAEPAPVRLRLCSLSDRMFTSTMYAELCRYMESCRAGRGSERTVVPGHGEGPAGILRIKIEDEDSSCRLEEDGEDGDQKKLIGKFVCTSCFHSFTTRATLKMHMKQHRPVSTDKNLRMTRRLTKTSQLRSSGWNVKAELEAPPTKFKSPVWKHFGFPVVYENEVRKVNKSKTVCKHCSTSVTYPSGNTTNMITHLKRHHPQHPIVTATDKRSSSLKKDCNTATNTIFSPVTNTNASPATNTNASNTSTIPWATHFGQFTLSEIFTSPLHSSSQRAEAITKAIGVFIASEMHPFSTIYEPGFRNLIQVLEPRYTIPSGVHFSHKVIPELHLKTKQYVQMRLKEAECVAITIDKWTLRATECYITILAHYIDKEWCMRSFALLTRPLHESHSGTNIADILTDAVEKWHLERPHTLLPVVADNNRNMDVAIHESGLKPHIKCFAHTVNIATQKGMKVPQMSRLLGRIRHVVSFFRRNSNAAVMLKSKQDLLQLPKHKLNQNVLTHWNNQYDMVERYLEQQSAVMTTLLTLEIRQKEKNIINISEENISDAKEIIKVLKPMKTITTILCDETSPAIISLILPMKWRIMSAMEIHHGDTALVRAVKEAIAEDINNQYGDKETLKFLLLACALDPRFKSLPHQDDSSRSQVYASLVREAAKLNESESTRMKPAPRNVLSTSDLPLQSVQLSMDETKTIPAEVDVVDEPPVKKVALEDLLGDVFAANSETSQSLFQRVDKEIKRYRDEPCIPLSKNPLSWWRSHEQSFPLLSKVARMYLGIPAKSLPTERAFSTAVDVITAKKAALTGENVDMLIFLKKNMEV